MLAVDGHDGSVVTRRSLEDERAAGDHALLVGEREGGAGLERRHGGTQAGGPDDGVEDGEGGAQAVGVDG